MKALETYGYQGAKSLHQAALEKFGSEAGVAHQLRLEARRRRYAATVVPTRNFPAAGPWTTAAYVAWFETANHLKGPLGETK